MSWALVAIAVWPKQTVLDITFSAIVVLEGVVYRGRRSCRMGDSNTHLIERVDYIARRVQPQD